MPVIHCLVNEADRGEHFVLRRKTQGGGSSEARDCAALEKVSGSQKRDGGSSGGPGHFAYLPEQRAWLRGA